MNAAARSTEDQRTFQEISRLQQLTGRAIFSTVLLVGREFSLVLRFLGCAAAPIVLLCARLVALSDVSCVRQMTRGADRHSFSSCVAFNQHVQQFSSEVFLSPVQFLVRSHRAFFEARAVSRISRRYKSSGISNEILSSQLPSSVLATHPLSLSPSQSYTRQHPDSSSPRFHRHRGQRLLRVVPSCSSVSSQTFPVVNSTDFRGSIEHCFSTASAIPDAGSRVRRFPRVDLRYFLTPTVRSRTHHFSPPSIVLPHRQTPRCTGLRIEQCLLASSALRRTRRNLFRYVVSFSLCSSRLLTFLYIAGLRCRPRSSSKAMRLSS